MRIIQDARQRLARKPDIEAYERSGGVALQSHVTLPMSSPYSSVSRTLISRGGDWA